MARLTPAERQEIRVKLAELDGDGWLDAHDPLTDEEKKFLDERLQDMEKHPAKLNKWNEGQQAN